MYELIKKFEGLRLTAYLDGGGAPTLGYGRTAGVQMGDTCTIEQAEQWLQEDAQQAIDAVDRLVTIPLTKGQREALVSLIFNIGVGAFEKSTLLRRLNSGDHAGAAKEFDRWVFDNGKRIPGLANRRKAERKLFEEKPMLPFIAAALPALIQAAPSLIRIFGQGERSEKNAQAAEKVVEIAKVVTGETTAEGAVQKIQTDPAIAQAFAAEATRQFLTIEGLIDKRIEAARTFNTSEPPIFGNIKFIHILSLLIAAAALAAIGYILITSSDPNERTMALQTLLIGGFAGVIAYWLGSSSGSDKKTEMQNKGG